jgi:hypothetical protein
VRESNTNWFGGFSVRMEGSPDMSRCTARVVQGTGHCGASGSGAPPPRELTLAFRMLGLALYTVPPLLSQPEEPMDFCPGAAHDGRRGGSSSSSWSPPRWPVPVNAAPAPSSPPPQPASPFWRRRLPPIWRKPPTMPQDQPPRVLPPPTTTTMPPPPPPSPPAPAHQQGSACTYEYVVVVVLFFDG